MPKKVLICDDDEGITDVAKYVLEEKGYDTKIICDGRQMESAVQDYCPDVILLDLWMPEMAGDEVARILKANSDTKNIPVIILSASRDMETVAKSVGADGFLPKPFDIVELEQTVDRYLS